MSGFNLRRAFDRGTAWIVELPWLTVLLVSAITGLALLGYRDPDFFRSRFQLTSERKPAERPDREEQDEVPPDVDPVSLAAADAILVVESDSVFTPMGAAALRSVVERLEAVDFVDNVLWMDRVPILNIFGLREPLFPKATASPQRFMAAKAKALAHPLVAGQLLSADGRTLLLMVNLDWFYVDDDEDCSTGIRQVAEQAVAEFPGVEFEFSVTGRVPIIVTAMNQHEQNQFRYQLIGYGMVAIMALILFRNLTAVFVVALAPSLGVFWTLGIIRFFDLHDNPFSDVVLPVLLSLVGLTDGVHLMVQIRRLRVSGFTERDAARQAICEVGLACALTSITTAIGFGSLSLAHHEVVREFGWSCVIGVLLTFVAVITVIPLVSSTWLGIRVHSGYEYGVVDKHLGRIGGLIDWVLRYPRTVAWTGIISTILLAVVSITNLKPDERNADSLPEYCEPLVAWRKLDRALGGLELGSVNIGWSREIPSDSAQVLEVVTHVDDLVSAESLIGHPLSIRNLLDALPGEGPLAERMSLLELLPPPLKRAFYTPERRVAQVSFRVQDLGIARYGPVFTRVEKGLEDLAKQYPQFTFEMSGSAVWRWENLYQIVVDLAASLGSAAIVILIVLTMAYQSVRIGLISLVPNLFPLAVTGTFLVLTGQALEVVSVCAFTICLGIAVDDSIHFLTRFKEEQLRTENCTEAIHRSFVGVGSALIVTTVILIAGFLTVLSSGLRDHRIFASMGGLTIAAALFADLVFLPALLACYAPTNKRQAEPVDA